MIKQLKLLTKDFLEFNRKDYHPVAYLYTLLFLGLSLFIVYGTEFGKNITHNMLPTSYKVINNILLYIFMYFIILVPNLIFKKETVLLLKPAFWIKSILFVSLIGFADVFTWTHILKFPDYSSLENFYVFKVLWRCRNAVILLPVFIFYRWFIDKDVKGLYGVCRGNHHIKAYLSLYVVILPILMIISFTPDFQTYYPSFKPWLYEGVFERSLWLNTLIYEGVYMTDFFMVELVFRGAMVIGMASLIGRNAVLPMVAIYVTLHFGKPVMETMSAIVGGYFLGAIAYQSRHIWGGIIIHMGIALIIELLRFFQHYVMGIG